MKLFDAIQYWQGLDLPIWAVACGLLAVLWLVTSRVNSTRLGEAVRETAGFFEYRADSKLDSWRALTPDNPHGDCDDFVTTVIHRYSGSGIKFLWNISNLLKFRIWYVIDPRGISHAVAVCGKYGFDNHKKKLVNVTTYKDEGYKFRFPWPFPLIWLKLLIGKL